MNNEIKMGKTTALFLADKYGEDAPLVSFSDDTYEGMEWVKGGWSADEYDYVKPTEVELKAKWEEIKVVELAKGVRRTRVEAYPSLGEQADMQYHDAINGTTTWKDAITAIKEANPKAEEIL